MRKKNFLLTMAAALAFVSCSQDELLENQPVLEQNAIAFDTYVGDNAQGRAVVVDDDYLKLKGFVVDAYYTGQEDFSSEGSYEGNAVFMNSTKVTYDDVKGWTYSPVKYWPNNEGDKVSFFAYGPYGSTQISFNNYDNHSKLSFTVNPEAKNQVDLIYHQANGDLGYEKTIDMEKPTINKKIKFNFLHALSRIAFDVKAVVDDTNPNSDNLLDGNTRINIKQIALVNTVATADNLVGSFHTSGILNMLDGNWDTTDAGEQGYSLTGDDFYRAVEENGVKVAQLTKFNPSQQLNDEDSYLMIIPQDFSEDKYKIYIEYDVISEEVDNNGQDTNNINDGNTITNQIFSVDLDTNFESGKAYKFTLLLGMTSVKVDAEVADWEENEEEEVWLPENEVLTEFAYDSENNQIQIKNAADLTLMRDLVNSGATFQVNESGDGVVTVTDGRASSRSGEVMEYAAASYLQVGDIDLGGMEWTPIGYRGDDTDFPFKGSYDVAFNEEDNSYYKIKNLTINNTDGGLDLGLFGCVLGSTDTYASLSGIWLENPTIEGQNTGDTDRYTGGVVGYCQNAKISECDIDCDENNENSIISDYYAGGFVGYINADVDIQHCTNHGVKIEGRWVGGICGQAVSTTVYSCYNYGQVEGRGEGGAHAGGIVGFCNGDMTIESCANYAAVESTWTSGGIVGVFTGSTLKAGSITASYNLGSISGDGENSYQGGIVGWASAEADITACYNTAETISNANYAGGIIGLAVANNITLTACYSTTTTFTNASTYGGIVGYNVGDATTYTPSYSACYYALTEGLTAWGYADQDEEGVCKVGSAEDSWNEPVEEMNKVLTGWEYTLTEGSTPTVNVKYVAPEEGDEESEEEGEE